MKKNIILRVIFLIYFLLLLPGCGFTVAKKAEMNEFAIKEIRLEGERRINFKIKSKILFYTSKISQRNLLLNLNTKKIKTVKEKSMKNEITKYQIVINVDSKFNIIETGKSGQFSISSTGYFDVSENLANTLDNEKNLIDNLVEDLSDKIIKEIDSTLNDF